MLNGADGVQQVRGFLTAVGISQSRHAAVAGVEHQILEVVRFIDEQMVYSHLLKIYRIFLLRVDCLLQLVKLGIQILFALLQTAQNPAVHMSALFFVGRQIFIYVVHLLPENLPLHLGRLGYLAELFVRKDDAVPVVVLDVAEDPQAVLRREVLLAGIEQTGIGIGRAEGSGDFVDVGFDTDDHRLAGQSQTMHLIRCDAHDKRLARTDLVVADAAAVLLDHPDRILLAGIQVFDTQPPQVEPRKLLVAAVVAWTDITVEFAVVEIGQPLLEIVGLRMQPFDERLPDFGDERVGLLPGLEVGNPDGLAVFVLAAVLVDVGQRVEHGMMQQIHTVVDLEVPFDDVFLGDQRAVPVVLDAEGIHLRRIAYRYGHLKEMLAEAFVNIGRYPSLAEVEIQLLELDAFGCGLTKQRERAAAGIVVGVLFEVIFDSFGFGDDIPCREPFADFIPLDHRIIENEIAQLVDQLLPGARCERLHIGKLHPSELVERGGQRFGRRIDVLELVRIE